MNRPGESAAIRRFLDRLRNLLASVASATALLRLGAVVSVALLLNTLVVERLSGWPWVAFALAVAGYLGLLAATAGLLLALARRPSLEAAARRVQAVEPGVRNDVESSLALEPLLTAPVPGTSSQLVAALVGSTGERLAAADPRRFVSWRALRAAAALCAAGALALAAVVIALGVPATAVRALADPRVYWPLGRLLLTVEPGNARIASGTDLAVRVRASGARPDSVVVAYAGGAGEGLAQMERGPDGVWSWRFAAVTGEFTYRALARDVASPWYRVQVAQVPVAGNFEVRYTYPAYSALPTRTITGVGELEALKGTSVEIGFTTSAETTRAALVFGENRVATHVEGERRHRAALYLDGARSYRIELATADGIDNGAGPQYAVRYLPDAAPTVEITEPAGDLESDPRGSILVRYRCADDYGIARLAFVARSAAGERRQSLPLVAGARSAGGEYEWDLTALAAEPGEVVTGFVEAADNDTISGPKTSASALLRVRIADPREKREETREALEKLAADLQRLRAQERDLEERYQKIEAQTEAGEPFPAQAAKTASVGQEAARETAARAEERAARLAEAMDRDPGAREDSILLAELLQQGIAELRAQQQAPMQQVAAGLEQAGAAPEEAQQQAAFLAATAKQAARKAEDLMAMAETLKHERGLAELDRDTRDMAGAEERLLEGLDRMKPGDRAAAAEVLKQLEQIEQALRELDQMLKALNKELPEEFQNSDALKGLDLGEMLAGLDQVRDLLKKGDLAGARQAARQLAKQLGDLRSRLRQAQDELDDLAAQALERLSGDALPRMQSLVDRQRAVLKRSEALEGQVGPRLEQALREMARSGSTATPPVESDLLTSEERGRADALTSEQESLRLAASSLALEVEALRGALPFLPAEIGSSLNEASALMREAGESLGRREPARALPPERGALAALERAKDRASQASDEMSQMQQMRRGGSPGQIGLGAPGMRVPGGQGSRPDGSRRPGGRRGTDTRNFLLPGRQDHRVPKIFREELMKSLQDGYPARYEERIKDYYQRIAE